MALNGSARHRTICLPCVPCRKSFAQNFALDCDNSMQSVGWGFMASLQPSASPKPTNDWCTRLRTISGWCMLSDRSPALGKCWLTFRAILTESLSVHGVCSHWTQAQKVTFAWKDYADGSKRKTMCLEVREFVRRFCLHLLPERFVKIRHFGFLSNRQRKLRVAQARASLGNIQLACPSAVSSEPPRVCPHCGSCFLLLVEIVAPLLTRVPRPLDSS